jgi:hypothetical protein
MGHTRPDLSGAYGDREESLSWPKLILVILYTLTIGWVCAVAHMIWLWVTSLRWPTKRAADAVPPARLRHN